MLTSPGILEALRRAGSVGAEIRLLNLYKGVPISNPAELVEIRPEAVRLRTERNQLFCLHRERETYLQSPAFSETFHARLAGLDAARQEAVLIGFELAGDGIGERMRARVQPGAPLPVDLQPAAAPGAVLRGRLADLSPDGLAIFLPKSQGSPRLLAPGARLTVTLHLPGEYEVGGPHPENPPAGPRERPGERFSRQNLRLFHLPPAPRPAAPSGPGAPRLRSPQIVLQGTVANLTQEPAHSRSRVGVLIHPTDPANRLIAAFLAQRQSEIIRELRDLSANLR